MAKEIKVTVTKDQMEELRTNVNLATKQIIAASDQIKQVAEQLKAAQEALDKQLKATYAQVTPKQEIVSTPKRRA